MRIPAKIRPPRQMTAPAYIANVLKVFIKVSAPEKSIVPWAWATALLAPMNVSAVSVGAITRAASRRFRLEKICASRLARRAGSRGMTALLGIIGTSGGLFEAAIFRELSSSLRSESNNLLDLSDNLSGARSVVRSDAVHSHPNATVRSTFPIRLRVWTLPAGGAVSRMRDG